MKKLLFFILITLVSCSPASTQSKSSKKRGKKDENPKPAWLIAKPDEGTYYIGIGHAAKDGQNNYIQEAKKSALEDLVSEIKVNVSSTSVLNQLDNGKEFQEKYQQMIQTTATDDIEEFEQVDVWQDDRNYWVYYRLSKQRYKEIKEQLKRNAVTLGLDFFTKAREAEKNNDPVTALGFYYQGFRAVEKYLAEPLQIQFNGKDILLTNEIIASMQLLLDKMQLNVHPTQIMVNRIVAQSGQTVTTKVVDKAAQKPISGLPLIAAFEKGAGDVFPDYKTDDNGTVKILLTKISSRDLEQTVAVKVNLLKFAGDNPSAIYSLVSQKIVVPKGIVVMNVQRPLVYVSSIERNLGIDKTNQQVVNKIKNYLATAGFEFTSDKKKAELALDVNSNSEKGAVSGSIFITYATSVIRVSSVKDDKEIYATTLDRVKGFSLDYERSSQDAYNKLLENLDSQTLPEMLNAILQ
ncbi:MAG: LPP20 family lipoprotein [Bacteroidetes bacterium]|nr:LPP20 family lipoprotein [Bacteroidota bacterium]MBI3483452.1 LPP20 family lipoprotein [Bacteroidota bacterium]